MNIEDETTEGDPWSVLPIKTRKYAKDCKEIVLSDRKINKLVNFDNFENLEALWLTNNKLEKFNHLNTNFRVKILCIGNNRLSTLEGSLPNMKFLQTLFLNNNKLRNLDNSLLILKELSFLKNLNLFGNPLAEEPEYRNRVIYSLPSLDIFDRHKITLEEKINCERIVKEFLDPLSKKSVKRNKRIKIFENFSRVEKDLFNEADEISKRNERNSEIKNFYLNKNDLLAKNKIPLNNSVMKNFEKYYDKISPEALELNNNDIRRVFGKYDSQGLGYINKSDIQYIFLDIKNILEKANKKLNERIFVNKMLTFYTQSDEICTIENIKKCLSEIINSDKSANIKTERVLSPLGYLKKISNIEKKKFNDINDYLEVNKRNDVYPIKLYGNKELQKLVIINENKLQSIYK